MYGGVGFSLSKSPLLEIAWVTRADRKEWSEGSRLEWKKVKWTGIGLRIASQSLIHTHIANLELSDNGRVSQTKRRITIFPAF